MPVYATASGQPLLQRDVLQASHCNQAWRWNLDYVTDPHGDAIAYFYNTRDQLLRRDNGDHRRRVLHPGRVPAKIEYGFRAGDAYTEHARGAR